MSKARHGHRLQNLPSRRRRASNGRMNTGRAKPRVLLVAAPAPPPHQTDREDPACGRGQLHATGNRVSAQPVQSEYAPRILSSGKAADPHGDVEFGFLLDGDAVTDGKAGPSHSTTHNRSRSHHLEKFEGIFLWVLNRSTAAIESDDHFFVALAAARGVPAELLGKSSFAAMSCYRATQTRCAFFSGTWFRRH
jgi:hypothetical protein